MFGLNIKSLRSRMLLWVFCASIVPYVIGGSYIGQLIMKHTERSYVQSTREIINNIQHNLDYKFLSPVESLVSTLAQDERIMNIRPETLNNYTQFEMGNFVRRVDPVEDTLSRYFITIEKNHTNIGTLFLASTWGGYMETPQFSPKTSYDPRLRSWYKGAVEQKGEIVTTDPYITAITGQMVISITHTVERMREDVGVVGVMLHLTEFQKIVENTQVGQTGYLMVLNPRNKFVVSPRHPEWLLKTPEELGIEELVEKENQLVPYVSDGKDQMMLINTPDERGWRVVAVVDRAEIIAQIASIRNSIIGVYCITLVLVLLTIIYATTRITKPLSILTSVTTKMANGNLEMTEFAVESKDELGQLAEAFSIMAKNLKRSYTDLESQIAERTTELMERRKAEEALATSEEKFSKAFRFSSDAIGIVRVSDLQYREVSDAFYSIFGYSQEEVIGKTSLDFNLWAREDERFKFLQDHSKKGFVREAEVRWRTKTGEIRSGTFSAELINVSGEEFSLFVWHDITERQQAEDALREARDGLEIKVEERTQEFIAANQELQSINEELVTTVDQLKRTQNQLVKAGKMAALGGLVAGVAHEINTPLGVALTAASHLENLTKEISEKYTGKMLKREQFEGYLAECQEATHLTLANLNRADRLIRSFKKVSVDQTSEARRLFNVKYYIEETLLSLSSKLKNTRHTLLVSCAPEVQFDSFPGGFSQILTNLIMNSLTHAYQQNDAGQIYIGVVKEDAHLTVTFSDDGEGMEEAVLKKIFDPFFTTKRDTGGSGLGLHIVYNIVTQQFKGTIECQSTLGQGTVFIIKFPLETVSNAMA